MPLTDMSLNELRDYTPELLVPDDLEAFWRETIDEAHGHDLAAEVRPIDSGLRALDSYDVSFAGYGGTTVRAWLNVPAGTDGPLPTVVQYHGYSGNRGFPFSSTLWAQAGYAHFVMDTRGQGWSAGGFPATDDLDPAAGLAHAPGFMTSGLTDPYRYYYRRVYTDALRMLEVAIGHRLVDPTRVAVIGGSQGGGISIAAAGLAALTGIDLAGAATDVPFLCDFPRALDIASDGPYLEITRFLAGWTDQVDAALRTLSYFDGAVLGRWATAPALFSAALMDPICPPSTVFAAFHHYGGDHFGGPEGDKSINVYRHNEHEGGHGYQKQAQLEWFADRLG